MAIRRALISDAPTHELDVITEELARRIEEALATRARRDRELARASQLQADQPRLTM